MDTTLSRRNLVRYVSTRQTQVVFNTRLANKILLLVASFFSRECRTLGSASRISELTFPLSKAMPSHAMAADGKYPNVLCSRSNVHSKSDQSVCSILHTITEFEADST